MFDTIDDSSTGQDLLVAIHRHEVSDACLVFLFDDYAAVEPRLDDAPGTLVFRQRPAGEERPG